MCKSPCRNNGSGSCSQTIGAEEKETHAAASPTRLGCTPHKSSVRTLSRKSAYQAAVSVAIDSSCAELHASKQMCSIRDHHPPEIVSNMCTLVTLSIRL